MKSATASFPQVISDLRRQGQSPWLDFISREILSNGKLKFMIEEQGLLGVTSNPSIFQKSISDPKGGYDKDIQKMIRAGASTFDIYDALTLADIQETCDLFRPVFKESAGEHGFVSLEVLPGLAHEEEETVEEARRLFKAVNRPNVMIKVPATPEGIPAVRRLIGEGININITLMFSLKHYKDVAEAYLSGLEDLKKSGGDLSRVHSVASVFVSRIDTLIDKKLAGIADSSPAQRSEAEALMGKAANANSKIIYQEFKTLLASKRFKQLQEAGANVQKVLWGSTSTKNPNYPDLLYVEPLIGAETVNTLPLPTFEALIDHGKVQGATIEEGTEEARAILAKLRAFGLPMEEVCETLQREGVQAFCDAFDSLMAAVESARLVSNEKKNE